MERLLSVKDVARLTGWSPLTIYNKSLAGEIPGKVKLGVSLRFRESDVQIWLNGATATSDRQGGY